MSIITDPQRESGFRLSMLINDTRYRSLTFQAIAAILLALSIWYLGTNLARNLAEAGLNISFDFLANSAGYDINQRLVEYSSQSTNARAALVGILNTLLVAVLACITATFFGVVAGVLRLSNNWLIKKLMAVYVEIFRNIPVLIWIIIIFTIMTATMPSPRAYRGETPDATMLFDAFAFTNRGVYVPAPVFDTAFLVVLATFIASVVAILAYRRYATRLLMQTGRLLPTGWPTLALLFLPTMIVMFIPASPVLGTLFILVCVLWVVAIVAAYRFTERHIDNDYLGNALALFAGAVAAWVVARVVGPFILGIGVSLGAGPDLQSILSWDIPALKGFNFGGGIKVGGPLIALWFALSIYTGAFIAENVRAGIQAISKGQTEAAAALGLRPGRVMNLVVLPQAMRVIIPPLISHYLNITKNSSLAIAVGYADITATLGGITLNQTGRAIECVLLLMLFYLTISLTISAVMNVYNNSVKLKER